MMDNENKINILELYNEKTYDNTFGRYYHIIIICIE